MLGREPKLALNLAQFGTEDETRTWCTWSTDLDRYIIINFSTPVLITSIISSGTTEERTGGFQTFHVTNFTLEYLTIENNTEMYNTDSENPKVRF